MKTWISAQFIRITVTASLVGLLLSCSNTKSANTERAIPQPVEDQACQLEPTDAGAADAGTTSAVNPNVPDYLSKVGCASDFEALASLPLDLTIPGVRSMKYVIDTQDQTEPDDDNIRLYFQNSVRYPRHVEFCSRNIKGVANNDSFNDSYYGPVDRRFMLGSISHYETPDIWALELAAYDTSTPSMIKRVFDTISTEKAYFRPALAFHPASVAQAKVAQQLDPSIPVVTTEDIYGKTDYQPLVRAMAKGVLTFLTVDEVNSGQFIPYNAIVVLDEAPNDISVVAGIITEQFQSPLSHINVLANNRKTPNMGLRNAKTNPDVLKFKDQWVQLTVGPNEYEIIPVDPADGEKFYEEHKPWPPIGSLVADNAETRIQDIEALVPNYIAQNADSSNQQTEMRAKLKLAVAAYGGKSANYSVLAQTAGVPVAKAFAIPLYYYDKFMRDNGFYDLINSFLADENFNEDAAVRQKSLQDLRNAMMQGQLDPDFMDQLEAKITKDFTGKDGKPIIMRFRTSTNSEDLDGFPCAGCYNSQSGDPSNWQDVWDGIRAAYTSAWLFRTFEERSYYGVDHLSVGMGLLVHHKYINEVANGVAVTANPFDLKQSELPSYYVNVAYGGDNSVVALPVGVTSDQFLYFVSTPNQDTAYLSNTNQPLPAGQTTVLTNVQVADLGKALTSIRDVFKKAYAGPKWYAMDCEFKFAAVDAQGNITDKPVLWLKQARPYPDPNSAK